MVYRNGFFQLVIRPEGVFVKAFPPRNGGRSIDFDELTTYLNSKKISYDLKGLHTQVTTATEPVLIKISNEKVYPEGEKLELRMDATRMTVTGRFIPPSTGGAPMKKEDILGELSFMGIRYGVKLDVIDQYLAEREYCTDFVLAEGKEPRHGKDAEIIYHFNTSHSAKPKQNEDGSVDFHDLDVIARVEKGDLLATLIKEDPGEPGMDVNGNVLKPRVVKRLALKYGKNITLSEDGLKLFSDVSGHVSLDGDRVFVSDTYIVPANVDNSTGDINYDGNVEVKGNVITGFTVVASGDIIVNGAVEGANLKAGGQIILKRGIQGMNKGVLTAGSNIIARFIENSEVNAGGYVSAEAILHSTVSAKGDVVVDGKKGFVTGGSVRSGSMIQVKAAGSTMGTNTVFEVGIDPAIMDEYHQIEKTISELEKEKTQNLQVLAIYKKKLEKGEKLSADKMLQLKLATSSHKKIEEEVERLSQRYDEMTDEIENFKSGVIKIRGIAYPGVKIVISTAVYYVRSEIKYSQFIKEGADVRVTAL